MGPVAPIISVVSGLFGIYSGYKSYQDSKEAAKDQEKMAALSAQNIAAEGAEERRRASVAEGYRHGRSVAEMGASGLMASGSPQIYEQAQMSEFDRQMAWLQQSTSSRSKIARLEGSTAASQTRAGGETALWSGIGTGAKTIAEAGTTAGWWS